MSVSAVCHVQWQELSAELKEHQKENLALFENIKRSRQALTAGRNKQRNIRLSFLTDSSQLKNKIRCV